MSDRDPKTALNAVLGHEAVKRAAEMIRKQREPALSEMLELGRAMAEASGDVERERGLKAELVGYDNSGLEVPQERRVAGYASPFPVRAIGLLDPEEIFLANREKFAQVTLTIGQPVRDLETALEQIAQGGVLALKVPASEVSGEAANTDPETEVFIYILPREIERVLSTARKRALDSMVARLVDAIAGAEAPMLVDDDLDITTDDTAAQAPKSTAANGT
ncbi:MAG: hypothetical protein U1E65_36110 [Myxococcota bacterium]